MKNIEVPALARVEGEGGLYIGLENGEAVEIRLDIYEPPRFFEALPARTRFLRKCPTSPPASAASARSPIR
ncbi:MAG: hypothetical protein MZV64_62700 [Ignavibacteriales bacterium]|nr:hypothetical protein [Ignavibacteriales bacterium]